MSDKGLDSLGALVTTPIRTPIHQMTPTQLVAAHPAQIAVAPVAHVAALPPTSLAKLSPLQLSALSPAHVAVLSPAHIAALGPTQLAALQPAAQQAVAQDAGQQAYDSAMQSGASPDDASSAADQAANDAADSFAGPDGSDTSSTSSGSSFVSKAKQAIKQAVGILPPPNKYGPHASSTAHEAVANALLDAARNAQKVSTKAKTTAKKSKPTTIQGRDSDYVGAAGRPSPDHQTAVASHATAAARLALTKHLVEQSAAELDKRAKETLKDAGSFAAQFKKGAGLAKTGIHGYAEIGQGDPTNDPNYGAPPPWDPSTDPAVTGPSDQSSPSYDPTQDPSSPYYSPSSGGTSPTSPTAPASTAMISPDPQTGQITDPNGNVLYPAVYAGDGQTIVYPSADPNVITPPVRGQPVSQTDMQNIWHNVPSDGVPYPGTELNRSGSGHDQGAGSYAHFYDASGNPTSSGTGMNGYEMHGDGWWWYGGNGRYARPGESTLAQMQQASISKNLGPLIGNPSDPRTAGLQLADATGTWFWQSQYAPATVTTSQDSAIDEANRVTIQTNQQAVLVTYNTQALQAAQQAEQDAADVAHATAQSTAQQAAAQGQAATAYEQYAEQDAQQQLAANKALTDQANIFNQWAQQNPAQAFAAVQQGTQPGGPNADDSSGYDSSPDGSLDDGSSWDGSDQGDQGDQGGEVWSTYGDGSDGGDGL